MRSLLAGSLVGAAGLVMCLVYPVRGQDLEAQPGWHLLRVERTTVVPQTIMVFSEKVPLTVIGKKGEKLLVVDGKGEVFLRGKAVGTDLELANVLRGVRSYGRTTPCAGARGPGAGTYFLRVTDGELLAPGAKVIHDGNVRRTGHVEAR